MTRKKSGVPKQKPPKEVIVATHLSDDPHALYTHVAAGWAAIKADTAQFPSPIPPGAQIDAALATLLAALQAVEGGTEADKRALTSAATKVRDLWNQLALYVQGVVRTLSPSDVPAVLASVLMYVSLVGTRKPKPAMAVTHADSAGSVNIVALAVVNALTYDWEWSLD